MATEETSIRELAKIDPRVKLVLDSARHLTAWQMACAMTGSGVDYRGCTKGALTRYVLARHDVEQQALKFRMTLNSRRESGVLLSDTPALVKARALQNVKLKEAIAHKAAEERRRGIELPGLDNLVGFAQRDLNEIDRLIAHAQKQAAPDEIVVAHNCTRLRVHRRPEGGHYDVLVDGDPTIRLSTKADVAAFIALLQRAVAE